MITNNQGLKFNFSCEWFTFHLLHTEGDEHVEHIVSYSGNR